MLNFTAGAAALRAACRAAEVGSLITSRRFIAAARLEGLIAALEVEVRIFFLEEIGASIGAGDRLLGLLAFPFARWLHRRQRRRPDDPAVVLFTSGSEGNPKGVVLSHRNLLSNRHQLAARIDFSPSDAVFNALPIFHSFGLTGGMLLPLLAGIRTFLYPSPLHYRVVPALVYDSNATILFGTDTFLAGYARQAHAYDFYSVRYVFAGAEKVKDRTREIYATKFGLRILEGYGATETSPVIAVNTPMHFKAGTVGRFLPGITWKLDPVPGIAQGGRLMVGGPNVMLGYLRADKPGVLEPPPEGTYDTGDIVTVDGDGFVTITGRAKRFAKVGGEMISLGVVEELADALWPGHQHAAVALADERKGEQVVLLSDHPGASREAFLEAARERGIPELMVPRGVLCLASLPLLGTGKLDYVAITAMARESAAKAPWSPPPPSP